MTAKTSKKKATPAQREAARAARAEKIDAMHDELTTAVGELAQSDQWAAWLDHLASFHSYSFNNTLLIQIQCPHASRVAGFRAWQDKGRQVRKGERGIRIFGKPFRTVTQTNEKTGEDERVTVPMPPPVVTVFDVSQTDPIEGAEVVEVPATPLTGDAPEGIYSRVHEHITGRGWTVTREPIPGEVNGYCTVDGSKKIVVDADLSPAQGLKTLIHETAHALMHADEEGKGIKATARERAELEAESVAYVVARLAGLDTSTYSVGYLTSWSGGDTDAVKATAVRVQATVHDLAEGLALDEQ